MNINADFSKSVTLQTDDMAWQPSPIAGVERRMLDRIGEEVARATSIVRYAKGSSFTPHRHGGGEEFYVLEGVFQDEHGDYPAGSYVRNPVGSSHTPASAQGCTIFVKLWQMDPADQTFVRINSKTAQWKKRADGADLLVLHRFDGEEARLVRLPAGHKIAHHVHDGGEEVLVLEGEIADEGGGYPKGTWMRFADGSAHAPFSDTGCLLFVKEGHLKSIQTPG